jgi:pimeloyl-ACP methyl ester carboxylesterase
MHTTTTTLHLDGVGAVPLTLDQHGDGRRAFLLLHGGAGPASMAAFAARLAASTPDARVLVPSHPGFGGTPRPAALSTIPQLAALYAALLGQLDVPHVTVIGGSIGGWIAAELALLAPARLARVVLVDAVGIAVDGHPVADVFSLSLDELMQLSYHEPARFRIDLSKLTDVQKAIAGGNRAALAVYGGQPTRTDATLLPRLAGVRVPTDVVWGAADRVVHPTYGRAFAEAIPGARFHLVEAAGHMPQLEQPEAVIGIALAAVSAPTR